MKEWIKEVGRGKRGARDLTYEEAAMAAKLIVSGESTDVQTAAFLMAERIKYETTDEILAFVNEYRAATKKIEEIPYSIIDFSGPYDGRKSFAATIPVSILMAESGIPVFLHGSDTLPPKNGTPILDIIRQLSLPIATQVEDIQHSLDAVNIGFAYTEQLCPALRRIRHIREEIGVRTIINTVEKLLNISQANSVMVGVFHKTAVDKLIPILQQASYKFAYIVQGVEGSEDLPIHRNSFIYKITSDSVESMIVKPEDYGLKRTKQEELEAVTLEEQIEIMTQLLKGENLDKLDYFYAQVLFNTGVRYFLFGHAPSIEAGIEFAERQIKEQKGFNHLLKWRQLYSKIS